MPSLLCSAKSWLPRAVTFVGYAIIAFMRSSKNDRSARRIAKREFLATKSYASPTASLVRAPIIRFDWCVSSAHNTSRGKYGGGSSGVDSDGILRIATNLLDVPAEIISLIYSERWAIENFFRFFKHVLCSQQLLSHSAKGIEIQTYCAIIACMMISLWTGRKPTLRTFEMICFYLSGMASEAELTAHPQQT